MSAEEHFSYLSSIFPGNPDAQKFAAGILLGVGIAFVGSRLSARIRTKEAVEKAVVPSERITLFGIFDFFVEAFVAFQDSLLGKENRKYLPFTGSVFLFILLANLIGLIPGVPAITTTVWVTVGMALAVFLYFNYLGIREHGLWGYIKHFMGPLWWLAWFIFPLELFSTTLRILTLNLRLYWNINADHMVLHMLTEMIPVNPAKVFAFPLYLLGTFVSFMQAFVFTTLTMVYILLATQHEDHDDHEKHQH